MAPGDQVCDSLVRGALFAERSFELADATGHAARVCVNHHDKR
jgi:hypothetical protein